MEASLPSDISVTAPLDNPTVLAKQSIYAIVANEVAPILGSEATPTTINLVIFNSQNR